MSKIRYYSILGCLLFLSSCFTPVTMFEVDPNKVIEENIDGFYAINIFEDHLSNDVWFSEEGDCLIVEGEKENIFSGEGALHVKWDKTDGNCPWLGLGFGWDGWNGKNFSQIYDHTAIQFKVKSADGKLSGLPVAMCLEDFGNQQAWTGFNGSMLSKTADANGWKTVTVPILAFNWAEFEADITAIKQFMIQFESAGDVFIDEMKIVEFEGSLKKRAEIPVYKKKVKVEDLLDQFSEGKNALDQQNLVQLQVNGNALMVMANVIDETPLENAQAGKDIWNGDAVEVAFSTNSEASPQRTYFLRSDQQIGIKAAADPIVWNWRKDRAVDGAQVTYKETDAGYRLVAKIPLSEFGMQPFEFGVVYGVEMAIDQGTKNGREKQVRWNSSDVGGFHENPSLWGEMIFIEKN